jgi:putative ABC transport system substrate-binding protein
MKRRQLLTLIGGAAAAWPLGARAQQPALPVIGFLGSTSANSYAPHVAAFRQALNEAGFIEGRNVLIEFRWADNHYDRLLELAADLVRRRVAVIIAAAGVQTALAAKAATAAIPIVFINGSDPVKLGLVASLNRPGGNITGLTNLAVQVAEKRLELARELVPSADVIAWLTNPLNPNAEHLANELENAARKLGRRLLLLNVSNEGDLGAAFATLVRNRAGVAANSADPIFTNHRDQLIVLAARHRVPSVYPDRQYVVAGGLMGYGPSVADSLRQVGAYAGRILKGAKPADLPVLQPTRFELTINLKTAKALGVEVPAKLLALANEVIE